MSDRKYIHRGTHNSRKVVDRIKRIIQEELNKVIPTIIDDQFAQLQRELDHQIIYILHVEEVDEEGTYLEMKGIYASVERVKHAAASFMDDHEVVVEQWQINSEQPIEVFGLRKEPLIQVFEPDITFDEWCERHPHHPDESWEAYEGRVMEEWYEFRAAVGPPSPTNNGRQESHKCGTMDTYFTNSGTKTARGKESSE